VNLARCTLSYSSSSSSSFSNNLAQRDVAERILWICRTNLLSRRDQVMVAWQFTARNGRREDPSRRARGDGYYRWLKIGGCACVAQWTIFIPISPRVTVHTAPYGTDLFRAVPLAVNCQATITRSLRDKSPDTCPHFRVHFTLGQTIRGRRRGRFRRLSAASSAILRCGRIDRFSPRCKMLRSTSSDRKTPGLKCAKPLLDPMRL
jgi:hypothetical protein